MLIICILIDDPILINCSKDGVALEARFVYPSGIVFGSGKLFVWKLLSDPVDYQRTELRGYQNVRVFIPVGREPTL